MLILKNFSFGFLSSLIRLFLGLTTFTLLTKFLKTDEFGYYSYLLTITGYLTIFVDFGFNFSSLNDLPRDKIRLKNNFYETIYSKLFLTAVGLIVILLLIFFIPSFSYSKELFLFLSIAILFSFSSYISHVFKAFNKFEFELIFVIINNLIPIIGFLIFSKELTIIKIGLILLISRIFSLIILSIKLKVLFKDKRIVSKIRFNFLPLSKNLKYAIHMIIGSLFLSIDIVVMKYILSYNDIAVYSVGVKLLMSILMIGEVINSSFIPRLSELNIVSEKIFNMNIVRLFYILFFLGFVFSIGTFFFGEFFIDLFFGNKYNQLIIFLPYFSILIMIRFLTIFFGTMVTVAQKQKYRAYTVILILPIHLILNIVLQQLIGIKGAIFSMIISFSIISCINFYFTLKFYPNLKLLNILK